MSSCATSGHDVIKSFAGKSPYTDNSISDDINCVPMSQLLTNACNKYELDTKSCVASCHDATKTDAGNSTYTDNSLSGDSSDIMTGSVSSSEPSSNSTCSLSDTQDDFSILLKLSPPASIWSRDHRYDNQDSPQYENEVDLEVSSSVDVSLMCATKFKRKRNRHKQPNWTPPPVILPPCRICDEKSSGYHYGANTCEACKGFFRRTTKKKFVDFRCKCKTLERDEWKRGPVKNSCPACRYERCLAAGMSKNAIKIGRYTLTHRTDNIKKVKSLESIDTMKQDTIVTAHAQEEFKDESSNTDSPELDNAIDDTDPIPANTMSRDNEADGRSFGIPLKEIDFIAKRCHDAHMSFVAIPNTDRQSLKREHAEYFQHFLLRQKTFGALAQISRDEYMDFFRVTGIDVDGRQQFLQEGVQYLQTQCVKLVKFARSIPGYSDLCLEDQASLVKASRVENLLVGSIKLLPYVSPELEVFTTPWGKTLHANEIQGIMPKALAMERFKMKKRLSELELTETETALFRALLITMPDRVDLLERDKVEVLNDKLLSCLQHMLHVRPGGPRNLLHRLCDVAIHLRSVADTEQKQVKQLMSDFTLLSSVELFREMIS